MSLKERVGTDYSENVFFFGRSYFYLKRLTLASHLDESRVVAEGLEALCQYSTNVTEEVGLGYQRTNLPRLNNQTALDKMLHKYLSAKWNKLNFPITEKIHNEVLSLPISPVIKKVDAIKIAETINSFHGQDD